LIATHSGEAGVAEVFRALKNRLRDSTWTVVFKALIIVHLMIREGAPDVTLKYLSHNPARTLAISNFTEGMCSCMSFLFAGCPKSLATSRLSHFEASTGKRMDHESKERHCGTNIQARLHAPSILFHGE
jgi:hypothetical protein